MRSQSLIFLSWHVSGYYECLCPKYYTGVNCEFFDISVTAGIGKTTQVAPTDPTFTPECIQLGCVEKARNGVCDVSFNS